MGTVEQLKPRLKKLSREDKVELTAFLLDCLQGDEDPEWQAAWVEELRRREGKKGAYRSADKVLKELDKKYA